MNQFINAILEMKKNNILAKIPLEPAEIEELKEDIYKDSKNSLKSLKKQIFQYVMFYQSYIKKNPLLKY
jgi:hypothetical protein